MPALPRTVALYLTSLACAERTVATIERALVAINQAHRLHGFESPRKAPEVTEVLQGIRRAIGVAPKQKDPVLVDTLRALIEPMRKRGHGRLPGPSSAVPRLRERLPALGALDVEDLHFGDDGLEITIRRSKTDQVRIPPIVITQVTHASLNDNYMRPSCLGDAPQARCPLRRTSSFTRGGPAVQLLWGSLWLSGTGTLGIVWQRGSQEPLRGGKVMSTWYGHAAPW